MNKTRFLILFLTAALLAVVIAVPARAQSSCQPGQYDDGSGSGCVDAPPGTFVPFPGATEAIPCAPGTYQDLAGQTSCKLAESGYYVPFSGAAEQIACPPGTTSPAGATACEPIGVVENPDNGNYYELVTTSLKWDDARAAAEARTYLSCTGHLATITSLAEDAFVQDTFAGRFWLGGFQDPENTLQSNANWAWVTGEPWNYTGWKSGEPNDFPIPDSGLEQALQMDQFFQGTRGWNDDVRNDVTYWDENNLNPEDGTMGWWRTLYAASAIYLVEYEGPCEADDQPPVADAGGPYSGNEGSAIGLSGSASGPQNATLTYRWTVDAPFCSFSNGSVLNPDLTCTDDGIVNATLDVIDFSDMITTDLLPWLSAGYRYQQISSGGAAPTGWETNAYDDSGWASGTAGFGTAGVGCPLESTLATTWSAGTDLLVRNDFVLPPGANNVRVQVAIDNDIAGIWVNGTLIQGPKTHENCATRGDTGTFAVADSLLNAGGSNVIAMRGKDRGGTSYLDIRVFADVPQSASDSVAVTVNNVAPELGAVSVDQALVPVGTSVTASASFTDAGESDTHTAKWNWGDNTATAGSVTQGSGYGSVSDSHTYTAPGVYVVGLTVTDDDQDSDTAEYQYVVVYDPTAGFVTGGGWFESLPGSYTVDPSAAGKATFGFVAKYKKGATTPDGNTQFQFKAGDLNFQSTSYEWLVVAGANAKYKGKGTINGAGEYGFMITANDSALAGGGTDDGFRIKIWDSSENVIYDNEMGAGADSTATTALGGGSIVIHSGR